MRMNMPSAGTAGLVLAVITFMAPPATAETMSFKSDLKASSEVPPNNSKGTGSAAVTYDTVSKMLNWTVTFTGLTGSATAAHFHGPADVGKTAGPVVTVSGTASPMKGTATLNDAQAADLTSGKWYLNVHTAAHKDGEIRGQVIKGK
jgi:hypothetical protein